MADDALRLVKAQFDRPRRWPGRSRRSSTICSRLRRRPHWWARAATRPRARSWPRPSSKRPTSTATWRTRRWKPIPRSPAFEDGKFTVWASTQWPFQVKQHVAQARGCSRRKTCASSRRYVGGGFGGKSAAGDVTAGARSGPAGEATGKPVQVVWDRAEEFFYDNFRPAAVVKIRAGLGRERARSSLWVLPGLRPPAPARRISVYDIPH